MCGLAGVLTAGLGGEGLKAAVGRMADTIVHRGPDDEGVWTDADSGVALGFRRLSILDLSPRGHQPMSSPSGRYTLVFNGEMYNHGEIRRELELDGFRFRGHSDTETIACAFERWGIASAIPRFNGMFAIAAWDVVERKLTLIRDRLGKKPLFYYFRPGMLTFGSELKALVAGPEFDRTLDPEALAGYLRYLYVPAPQSIYLHVRKLPPAHMLTIADVRAPLPDPVPYWSLDDAVARAQADPFRGTDAEALGEMRRLLDDAVRIRLESDVPLGALLSGGVDSSTVVATMQRAMSEPVKTFSIGFDEPEHNEAEHAARVARHIGTDHTELMLTAADAMAVVPRLADMFDEPLADPSQIPTYLVCALARRRVTVALTGDGGDELFAGYNRYTAGEGMIARIVGLPDPVRRAVAGGLGAMTETGWDRTYRAVEPLLPLRHRQRLPGEKIAKMARLLRAGSSDAMYRSLLSACQDPNGWLARRTTDRGPVEARLEACGTLPFLQRAMLTDQATYLPDDLLAKVDRASMAVSLEVRVPLLDYRLVEFSWRLPREMKIRDGQGKWLLRQVLYERVPRELVDRPKVGFSVPIAAWLRGGLRKWAEELLFAPDAGEILNPRALRSAWNQFLRGRSSLALTLWTAVMLKSWKARWLR